MICPRCGKKVTMITRRATERFKVKSDGSVDEDPYRVQQTLEHGCGFSQFVVKEEWNGIDGYDPKLAVIK